MRYWLMKSEPDVSYRAPAKSPSALQLVGVRTIRCEIAPGTNKVGDLALLHPVVPTGCME